MERVYYVALREDESLEDSYCPDFKTVEDAKEWVMDSQIYETHREVFFIYKCVEVTTMQQITD